MTDLGGDGAAVRVERSGAVVRLTLNRPESGNSINLPMARALLEAAICCDNDETVRCVVLTGAGRMFCSGGDVASLARAGDTIQSFLSELAGTLHMAMARFARMAKPFIVEVNGPAAGAGLSLAISGDIVIAARSSHFTAAYSAIGLSPDGGMTWLLPRLVGLRKAQEMIVTNRRIGAVEAEEIGLVTRTVDDDALAAQGALMAERAVSSAVVAVGAARNLLLQSYNQGLETQMELETRAIVAASGRAESREGIAAMLEKRPPIFEGI